jgi:chromosome segregation ATPase
MTGSEQYTQTMQNSKDIAALTESVKSAHKRIDNLKDLTTGINRLAENVAALTAEVKFLANKLDKNIDRIEQGQKAQGERLGKVELAIQQIERNEKDIAANTTRIETILQEPARKWKDLTSHMKVLIVGSIFCGIVGVVTFMLSGIFGR